MSSIYKLLVMYDAKVKLVEAYFVDCYIAKEGWGSGSMGFLIFRTKSYSDWGRRNMVWSKIESLWIIGIGECTMQRYYMEHSYEITIMARTLRGRGID